MKRVIYLILLCFPLSFLFSETLRFRFDLWNDYKLVSRTEEDVYINGDYLQKGYVTSKSSFSRMESDNPNEAEYKVTIMNLDETHASWGEILELSSEDEYRFHRDNRGIMEVEEGSIYPVLRNMMVLPSENVEPGDQWNYQGMEIHDLRRSYDVDTIRFPHRVLYTYKGTVQLEDQTLHLISTSSQFSVKPDFTGTPRGYFYPVQITGYSTREIYWDNETGRPVKVEEDFNISFLMADLQTVEYAGSRESLYEYLKPIDREKEIEEVQEMLNQQGIDDTMVTSDDEGMILTLNRIHFEPDSYRILDEEERRLQTLAEILKKFPGRDIVISGHTADVGNPEFQYELSRYRAANVAELLKQLLGDRSGIIITKGYGGTQPVSGNDTEAGRSLNRRVELKILDN